MAIESFELETKSRSVYQHVRLEKLGCLGQVFAYFSKKETIEHPWARQTGEGEIAPLICATYVSRETAQQLKKGKANFEGQYGNLVALIEGAEKMDPETEGGHIAYVAVHEGKPDIKFSSEVISVRRIN
jgi:hypothetical protein